MHQSNTTSDILLGQTIADRYWVISRLGAGAMGVAYRAWDERQGVPVVVKIPKREGLGDQGFAERFAREIKLLQGLSHPRIVPLVDHGEHEGLPFVAMRFLPGGSLASRRLRNEQKVLQPNPPGMLHLWLPAVAEALDHVHTHGVVHRDVKPANIFFDAFWGAFLGDFGIAKIVGQNDAFDDEEPLTRISVGIGTPDYMAPEQWTAGAILDGRADQYALAVVVYEMLAGSRPFRGDLTSLMSAILIQPPPALEREVGGLPLSLVTAVYRALSKKPRERFATCIDFATAALQDVPPSADDPDLARLLCPQCDRILKLPLKAAGREGSCPKCRGRLMVAEDLGALWLIDEEHQPSGKAQVDASGATAFPDEALGLRVGSTTGQRRNRMRRSRAKTVVDPFLAATALLGIVLMLVTLLSIRSGPSAPTKNASAAYGSMSVTPSSSRDGERRGSRNRPPQPRSGESDNVMQEPHRDRATKQPPASPMDAIDMALQSDVTNSADTPDPVVGRWAWSVGEALIGNQEFLPDGKVLNHPDSAWWVEDPQQRTYIVRWGEKYRDRLTLSADGSHLNGTNSQEVPIEANRID